MKLLQSPWEAHVTKMQICMVLFLEIISQIDWRKAKKKKIHRIYDEYRKPIFPWEIQASKLDECTQRPLGIWFIYWPNMHIWVIQIWSSAVSLKRSCKMQFRRVGLKSIGPSSQKLWPNQIFGWLVITMHKKIIAKFSTIQNYKVPLDSEISAQLFLLCLTSSVLSGILPTNSGILPISAVVLPTNLLQQQVTFDWLELERVPVKRNKVDSWLRWQSVASYPMEEIKTRSSKVNVATVFKHLYQFFRDLIWSV